MVEERYGRGLMEKDLNDVKTRFMFSDMNLHVHKFLCSAQERQDISCQKEFLQR